MALTHFRCEFVYVEITDDIVFIRDKNNGAMSITNDAEEVYRAINRIVFPGRRVVYQDTAGEWWEITGHDHPWEGIDIEFKPWHGRTWDVLTSK